MPQQSFRTTNRPIDAIPSVVAEERLPPLRWGLLCVAIKNAVNCFGEPGAPDLVRRDAD